VQWYGFGSKATQSSWRGSYSAAQDTQNWGDVSDMLRVQPREADAQGNPDKLAILRSVVRQAEVLAAARPQAQVPNLAMQRALRAMPFTLIVLP